MAEDNGAESNRHNMPVPADSTARIALAKARADAAQLEASDPMASVFVSASAGSGKTKLLIDRLLRLMLPLEQEDNEGQLRLVSGTDPARILCLTYTKAAAAEMATRLQTRLGAWVTLSEEALGGELTSLAVPNTPETRAQARALFLRVLDLPGGLRIETIHAFCQSLLRRFPIEAAIDPHFALMEESDSTQALREALEEELAAHPQAARQLAGLVGLEDLMSRMSGLNEKSGHFQPVLHRLEIYPEGVAQEYRALLGIVENNATSLRHSMKVLAEEERVRAELQIALPKITASARKKYVEPLLDWLSIPVEERSLGVLHGILFTKDGVRKMNALVGKDAQKLAPELLERLTQEGERQQKLQQSLRALELLAVNEDFLRLAVPVLGRFQREKTMRGLVDYNDLIARTRLLLNDPGAAWVMYKLDGGIDHLLLDEVQDTSGLQWEIAGALTEEFFSGEGVHDLPRPRTIFAVGDFKQSIYSFQGAEPDQFHHWRKIFAERVKNAGLLWREPELNVSFRSVPPVLELVDSVFAGDRASEGLKNDAESLHHVSARSGQGGRVEMWPLVPKADMEEEAGEVGPWRAPSANADHRAPPQQLAETLAEWLKNTLGTSPQPGTPPLKPEDVLILVPRRSGFLRSLVRALKARGVPVASFLRTGLTEQTAVQDLMTLCAALLLPQDDLSLACVLTSPLGGLSDDSLMALCTEGERRSLLGPTGKPLWTVLRTRHRERPDWEAAWTRLDALFQRVDYETPYSLLVQALGQQGGRARLLERLGPEAAEPLDELLNAALAYEERHTPSLQGFLHWLQGADISTRREAESAGEAVRLMTVHGAKGLQARLVILPDTTSERSQEPELLWAEKDGMSFPLWVPRKEMGIPPTAALAQLAQARRREESNRLLYVALTRASDWLVVCGWEQGRKKKEALEGATAGENSWYQMCREGFERLPQHRTEDFAQSLEEAGAALRGWEGETLFIEEACTEARPKPREREAETPNLPLPTWLKGGPDWQARPAVMEAPLARPLTPSRPEGAEFGLEPAAPSPLSLGPVALGERLKTAARLKSAGAASPRARAMQRGTLVHRLLQLLPDVAPEKRLEQAQAYLGRSGLDIPDIQLLSQQVMEVLDAPELAPLFGPGSRAEQAVSGTIPAGLGGEGQVVLGQVDRFSLHKGVLWLCDYKTGRRPSADPRKAPAAYLRQMAAYRAVLGQIYPDAPARCFLVWTEGGAAGEGPLVMELPTDLLEGALLPNVGTGRGGP